VKLFSQSITINLNLLRTLPTDQGLNIRSEFLPDLTRIFNETKITLIVKYLIFYFFFVCTVSTPFLGHPVCMCCM
jgi:hypothetical protein